MKFTTKVHTIEIPWAFLIKTHTVSPPFRWKINIEKLKQACLKEPPKIHSYERKKSYFCDEVTWKYYANFSYETSIFNLFIGGISNFIN